MKTFAEIDPRSQMIKEDFITLFAHLTLLEDELNRLNGEYFQMYEIFLTNDVEPVKAWVAVRDAFIRRETQVGTRQNQALAI